MDTEKPAMAKPAPTSTRNLLKGAFKRSWEKPAPPKKLLTEYVLLTPLQDYSNALSSRLSVLLKSPIGRDFTLKTASGVLFSIHSVMLIGGPKILEEFVFPGAATQAHPPTEVDLPSHYHPILIDRLVTFLYTSDYKFDPKGGDAQELKPGNFDFYTATHVPADNPPSAAVTALVGIRKHTYSLLLFALAEELAYPALQTSAYDALIGSLLIRRHLSIDVLKDMVEATFAPLGDPARICKDEAGVLQNLVVASVIAHEARNWNEQNCKDWADSIQAPGYAPFWAAYNTAKTENEDLFKEAQVARETAVKRAKAVAEREAAMQLMANGASNDNPVPKRTRGINKTKRKSAVRGRKDKQDKARDANAGGSDADMDMEI